VSTKYLFRAIKAKIGNAQRKLVLITLADIANEHGKCWPSHQYIADRAECSRRSVITHLSALEKAGIISIEQRSENGIKTSNVYRIHDVQEFHIDVQEFHKGSETVAQGGSETVAHNTPTLLDTPNEPINPLSASADVVIDYLNQMSGKSYRHTDNNRKWIKARLGEGFTTEDCCKVIANRCKRWLGTEQAQYLRFSTLFCPKNFEGYLNDSGETNATNRPTGNSGASGSKQTAAQRARFSQIAAIERDAAREASNSRVLGTNV
jgi:uncharacterized phage protein (TIGR02220 family)